ncbi:putative SnRNP Sm-like protein [Giardia muris]|uniref:Putative SnRNP Sm-like protein n=1 Tax=Giardia muris TaxID=5742 RepID=A0A4Z1SWD8_GIAMU|nr:putative SnRNP Sm-like protein [Giardia muris]|eukprot:TNJ30084.1 putative SnRNP Sm-like protein [Giardia muris]
MKQVLPNCVNYFMVVTLKNNSTVQGVLKSVDAQMNMEMANVKVIDSDNQPTFHDNYSLQGSTVSSIRIPDKAIKEATLIASTLSPGDSSSPAMRESGGTDHLRYNEL